jgi:hypothetical protein
MVVTKAAKLYSYFIINVSGNGLGGCSNRLAYSHEAKGQRYKPGDPVGNPLAGGVILVLRSSIY